MPGSVRSLCHLSACAILCLALLGLPACRKKQAPQPPEKKPEPEKVAKKKPKRPKEDELPPVAERTPEQTAALLKQIQAFTGARTKVVWNECLNPRRADPFSFTDGQLLKGLDTADPRGEHALVEKNDNYSRPLISPDGEIILYTRKNYDREHAKWVIKLEILRTDWKGTPPEVIGEGYALDLWRDPATSRTWVYAATEVPPQEERTFYFHKLVRFALDAPAKVEVIWNESFLSPDNIQLSRDGESLCALLPWPNAGVLRKDGDTLTAHKFTTGCWPSHSPDNSYVFWVFDGDHKSATFFSGDGKSWGVPFNSAPHLKRREVYHPRWSNHPRFMVLTGPYISKSGPPISKSGLGAQVQLGRFSEKLDKIEEFLQVTEGNLGAGFPVAWIEGGDKASLAGFSKPATKAASQNVAAKTWPAKPEGLVFLWKDRTSLNRFTAVDGRQHQAVVELLGATRSGRFHEMSLDGGLLRLAPDSATLVLGAWKQPGDAAFEALLVPPENMASAEWSHILTAPGLVLSVKDRHLQVTNRQGSWLANAAILDKPFHLAVSSAATGPQVWVNGQMVALVPRPEAKALEPTESVTFGGGWAGGIMHIALYGRVLSAEEAAADAQQALELTAQFPPAPPRVKLTGKLVEVSPVPTLEAIEPYTSSLVSCVYEVEKVEFGEFKDKRVLVKHWGLINRQATALFPREIGKSYELTIEREADHTHLKGERVSDETDAFDMEPWVDVATPRVP